MFLFQNNFESVLGIPDFLGYAFVFLFGAIVGSFLNVVIHRVPNEQSIVFPSSACPKCGKEIKSYDNIPILSWLILGGKCRQCKNPISPRYPAVELLTGILFVLTLWQIGLSAFLPIALIFVSAMIALIFIDSEHMILPDLITYPLLLFAILIRFLFPIFIGTRYFSDLNHAPLLQMDLPGWMLSIFGALLGALVGGGSLWLVGEIWKRLRGVEAMGLGDVKMMFGVGALLGWRLTLLTIFLAAFIGSIAGIAVVLKNKDKDFQAQIPFGIFLGGGAILALLFGDSMVNWYLRMFVPN